MARLPFIDPTDEPDELRPVFEQLRATRGRVPGMYRLLAHQPAVLAAHRAYFSAALDTGLLPRAFKEKIAFKVARLRGSAYSSASHRRYALDHGITDAEIEAVARGDYTGLEPAEAAALGFAEEMVGQRGAVADRTLEALKAHFSNAEIIEIVALVGIMELACSFAAAFGLEADRDAPS
ncbi:MAG: carboxymuconolactone decarboxylase family protein [Alphaproteobacteria bacterium]|nr:carboxymuconolactone decarboxylase family protein [Alphaproteobacteria bacterium]